MPNKIYYDDNIFFLNEIIKALHDGIRLDIDPELYLERIADDILFVEEALSRIFESLRENELMIRRSEHLKRLVRAISLFTDVLSLIIDGKTAIAAHLRPFFPKFHELYLEEKKRIGDIQELLISSLARATESTDIVSQEEFRHLLMESGSGELA